MRLFGLLVTLILFAGCSLPKEVHQQAEKVRNGFTSASAEIEQTKEKTRADIESDGGWLKPCAARERWMDSFDKGQAALKALEGEFEKNVKPLLKENRRSSWTQISAELARLEQATGVARASAAGGLNRLEEVKGFRSRAPQLAEQAAEALELSRLFVEDLAKLRAAAQASHPTRSEQIEARSQQFAKSNVKLEGTAKAVLEEFRKASINLGDYAVLGDNAKQVESALQQATADAEKLKNDLLSLDRTYAKTLVDMKQRLFAQVAQVAWDESSDANTEVPYTRPWVEIDQKTFEALDQLNDEGVLAEVVWGGRFVPKISEEILKSVNLNNETAREGWTARCDSAEYWLEDLEVGNYHKYVIEENGSTTETDWVEVTLEVYAANTNNLGMTIECKPFGVFSDEQIVLAAPPGMHYVGDAVTGKWSERQEGEPVWIFSSRYSIYPDLLGINHAGYTRSELEAYRAARNSNEPFYGGSSATPRYGSSSPLVSSNRRFVSSSFVKSGGPRQASVTVRSAGFFARGGGPGGGGK